MLRFFFKLKKEVKLGQNSYLLQSTYSYFSTARLRVSKPKSSGSSCMLSNNECPFFKLVTGIALPFIPSARNGSKLLNQYSLPRTITFLIARSTYLSTHDLEGKSSFEILWIFQNCSGISNPIHVYRVFSSRV